MTKQQPKPRRVDWSGLSQSLDQARAQRSPHKGIAILEQMRPGSMVATHSHMVYVEDMRPVPAGVLLTLGILPGKPG